MANAPQIQLDPIKYLNNLPLFNGNIDDLVTFTRLIDRVHPILASYDELSQLLFSDIIKSRIIGKAKEVIEINTQARSWGDIKNILHNNFGERKSSDQLYDELRAVTFQTNVIEFFNDIKHILRRLNNKTTSTLGEGEAANQVSLNNQRTALHIFKNKMPEPMKTILACRNPSSLEEAMDILYENEYDRMGRDGRFHPGRARHGLDFIRNKKDTHPNYLRNKERNFRQTQQNVYNTQGNGQNQHNQKVNQQNSYRNNTQESKWQNGQQSRYYQPQSHKFYNNNIQEQRWRYNNNNQNNQQQPEPMEINTAENFRQVASTGNYHI